MLVPILLSLISPAAPAVTVPPPVQQQALRVWMNRQETLYRGEKVRVYTRAADDGYLFVLHVEPNGRVRVLFPLDPSDDNFIRANQDYEIRGRGDREAFQVYETSGAGTVFAALSPDPFRFDPLVLNAHWDYRAPDWSMTGDPEADLTALASRLTGTGRFEYDLQRYVVGSQVAYGGDWYEPGLYDPYFSGHSWYGGTGFSIRVGLGFGHRYGRYWYDPWYWDPWRWDPYWAWDPWWYPSPCWHGCFYAFPYYRSPVYYGYPYYGPDRYVYVAAGVGRGYAFKSTTDRFGLSPDPVGPRRRTVASSAGSATAPSRVGVSPSGRRTTGASSAPGASRPTTGSTPERRPANPPAATSPSDRRSPAPAPRATPERRGSSGPSSTAPARPPASRPSGGPTRRQLSQLDGDADRTPSPPVGERLDDGSFRLPTPPRRTVGTPVTGERETVGTLERRAEVEPRSAPLGGERSPVAATPRGLRIATDAPAPRRAADDATTDRAGGSASSSSASPSRMPSTMREGASWAPSSGRDAPANISGGRRTPSASSAPSSRSPTTRAAPSPSRAPSARPAPRSSGPSRSTPSRPSGGGPSRRNR